MGFNLRLDERARDDLRDTSKADQAFILKKLTKELSENPFPRGNTIKKLQGLSVEIFRLRINASLSYRAFYEILPDNIVYVLRIVPKKDSLKVIKKF